ncbi:MAG: WYL domain-containing protein [Eubacteriales bacterium]|nr:WYL domain-containing protein [Eubacteriales bacterium]
MSINALVRQQFMLRALAGSKNGRSAEDLHRELVKSLMEDISLRTIYRDIDVLSKIFPITEEQRGQKIYYMMLDNFKLEEIQCSFDELMAVVFINRLLESLGHDPVTEAGIKLTDRLISGLPEPQRLYLKDIYQNFRVEFPGSEGRGAQIIQLFADAIRLQKAVRIHYHAFGANENSERIIHPYTIYFRQQYYIVAWCTSRNSIREFRLDRIEAAEMLETLFEPDPSFNYEEYSKRCWNALKGEEDYQVVLRFSPGASGFVKEYKGNKADRLKDLPDGSLEFHKSVSMLDEIFAWVLSMGSEAEVVAPEELKSMVKETIREQAKNLGLI